MTALRDITTMKRKGYFHSHKLCEYCLRLIPIERLRNIGGAYICKEHKRQILFIKGGTK